MSTTKVALRSEIPAEYTWDLESIYASPADWEAGLAELKTRLPHVRAYAGRLGEGPGMLAAWMDEYQALMRDAQRLAMYAFLGSATDAGEQTAAARVGQANSLGAEVQAAVAFAEPELMAVGFDTLRRWMAEETRLAIFAQYFDDLERMSAHIRSAEVEEVLGQVEDPFRTANATHGILANSELQFAPAKNSDGSQTFEVTHGSLGALLSDPDREVRRTAWENYADAHLAYKNTMANNLAAGIKQDVLRARVRRYDSSLEAALFPDNIPLSVFHNLLDVFKRNLPTWHRYWRLRRKALGVETLHEWDIKAPLAAEKVKVPYTPGGGLDLRRHGAAGRGVREGAAARVPAGAMGGHLPQQGQAAGRVFIRRPGHAPVHHDELQRRPLQCVDAGARVGAFAALVFELADAAADLCALHAVCG